MILIDANLLIYAIDADSPHHATARRWLEQTLSGTTAVGLPWIVILAFVRITTHPRIMRRPLPPEEALSYVDSWLQQPYVRPVVPGERHWPILRNLLRTIGTAGNLTSDAHLAALALEQGCTIYSVDNDFKAIPGHHSRQPAGLKNRKPSNAHARSHQQRSASHYRARCLSSRQMKSSTTVR